MLAQLTSLLLLSSTLVQCCFRSSLFYRSKIRSRSHVFAPGEYQPRHWEHTVDGSGPLDSRDFQHSIPNKHLVRVDSPLISFATEEARYMTEGCRDRLIKLAIQIQNTWADQRFKLHVLRGWIKPPADYKPSSNFPGNENGNIDYPDAEGPLRFDSNEGQTDRDRPMHHVPSLSSQRFDRPKTLTIDRPTQNIYQGLYNNQHKEQRKFVGPVVDMTPEMMIEEELPHRKTVARFPTFSRFNPSSIHRRVPYWTPWRSPQQWPRIKYFTGSVRNYGRLNPTEYKPFSMTSRTPRLPRDVESPSSNSSGSTNTENHRLVSRSLRGNDIYPFNRDPQPVSTMSQARFQQWLDIRMEEFHYAGRAVDFQITQTSYSSRKPFNLGVLAQIAYYVAQFDWCYYSPIGHVHCSVKPDSSITSQWFGCFPGTAKLKTENGQTILMKDLKIGDRIMTGSFNAEYQVPSTVVAFLHKDRHKTTSLQRISYQHHKEESLEGMSQPETRSIYLTPNHLMYIIDRSSFKPIPVFAEQVRPGDTILIITAESKSLQKVTVLNVTLQTGLSTELNGTYAPLTDSGTLIVDDVLVSCFAQFKHERLAWLAVWPMRFLQRIIEWSGKVQPDHQGVHWYLKFLYQLASSILPSSLFYQQM